MPRRRPSPCPRGRAPCRAARRRAQGLWARQSLSSPSAATGAPIRRHRRTTGSTRRVCTRRSPQHTCIARASPPRTLGDSQEDPLSSSGTGSPAWPLYMPSAVSQCRSCVPALPISCPMIRLFRMPRLGVQRSQIPARLRDRQVQQQEQGQHHSVGGGRCLMDWAAWIK